MGWPWRRHAWRQSFSDGRDGGGRKCAGASTGFGLHVRAVLAGARGGPGGRGRGLDGHGVDSLRVAAGRGPALDLGCVCAPARGTQLIGVRVAGVWPCLPSGDCAVWSRRLGFGAGLGMRDRRGMDAGCESGACCLRGAPCSSEFRASGYFVRSGSPARSSGQNKTLHRAWRSLLVGVSSLVFASSSRRGRAAGVAPCCVRAHPDFRSFEHLVSALPSAAPRAPLIGDPHDRPLASICELMASGNSASGLCQL
jgi:hypothetical protein